MLACASVTLIALLTAFLFAAGDARAAAGLEVALQDDDVFVSQITGNRETAFAQAQQMGVTRLRFNIIWSRVMPGDQAAATAAPVAVNYDFSLYDQAIAAAAAHGLRVQLTLTGPAPAWATANHRVGVYRPNAAAFAAFARAATIHFSGRVDRYTIWNEPNLKAWLAPLKSAAITYRALYAAGYAAIKDVDPNAAVLIGETAPNGRKGRMTAPLDFLAGLTCSTPTFSKRKRCAPLVADGYAHHPYAFTVSPKKASGGRRDVTMATLARLTRALTKLARRHVLVTPTGRSLDLYLTEFGYFNGNKRALPMSKRVAYLKLAFKIARLNPRVRQLLQYILVDRSNDIFRTGVVNTDGSPLPTFTGITAWAQHEQQTHGIAVTTGPISLPPIPVNIPTPPFPPSA
jgi:hypothetical protein